MSMGWVRDANIVLVDITQSSLRVQLHLHATHLSLTPDETLAEVRSENESSIKLRLDYITATINNNA